MQYFTTCICNTRCRGSAIIAFTAACNGKLGSRWGHVFNTWPFCGARFPLIVCDTEFLRVNFWRTIPDRECRVVLRVLTWEETLASPQRTLGWWAVVPAAHSSVVEENQVKTCPIVRDRKAERDQASKLFNIWLTPYIFVRKFYKTRFEQNFPFQAFIWGPGFKDCTLPRAATGDWLHSHVQTTATLCHNFPSWGKKDTYPPDNENVGGMSPNSLKMTPNPWRHAKLSEGLDKHLPKAHSWKPYGGELIGPVQARAWQKNLRV